MKPKEFDELVRQKFDRNDFAYKSANWDSLAEKLEGRAKKRNMIVWWWVPLAGMAASVALAMGSSGLIHHSLSIPNAVKTGVAVTSNSGQHSLSAGSQANIQGISSHNEIAYAAVNTNIGNSTKTNDQNNVDNRDWFHVRLNASAAPSAHGAGNVFNFMQAGAGNKEKIKTKKQELVVTQAYNTFTPEADADKRMPVVSVTLLGGYNSGNMNTGYTFGGTIRRMLNGRLYIESDVAFASSNNMQATQYVAVNKNIATKTQSTSGVTLANTNAPAPESVPTQVSYNLDYAQVNPGLGYKVVRKLSVGLGPDFQRMLVDNRPVVSTALDRNNIQVAPVFDVGFIGKTEYTITKRFKTTVSYRKGMNNFINPSDRFIDRDYLQFQLRYTIINR